MPPELRHDVRLLTTVLGEAIAASGGPELLADVEALRRATIALAGPSTDARRAAVSELARARSTSPRPSSVVRAFTCYFQLVNLAEERQRIRVLRAGSIGQHGRSKGVGRSARVARDAERASATCDPPGAHRAPHRGQAPRRGRARSGGSATCSTGSTTPGSARRRGRERDRRLARGDRPACGSPTRSAAHRPAPLDEVRATLALFDQTIFTTAAADLPRGRPHARPRGQRAHASRGSRRSCAGAPGWAAIATATRASPPRSRRRHGDRRPITCCGGSRTPRAGSPGPSRCAIDEVAAEPLRRALRSRDERRLPRRARELARTLPDAPHRRTLGLAADRLAATRTAAAAPTTAPPSFVRRPRRAATLARRRRRAVARLGRAAAPAVAGGDVRVPSRRDGGARARRRSSTRRCASWHREPRATRVRSTASPVRVSSFRRRRRPRPPGRSSPPSARSRDVQDRLGPDACQRVIVSFTRTAADLAGVLALARLACPSRPADVRAGAPARDRGTSSRPPPTILDDWIALPGTQAAACDGARSELAGDGRLLRLGEGDRGARREPRALPGAARDGRVGAGARPAAHDLPRPRRRARSRGRTREPRDPRPAARVRRRAVHGDRAGRDGVRALRRPDARPAPPRTAHDRRWCVRRPPATRATRPIGSSEEIDADGAGVASPPTRRSFARPASSAFFRRVTPIAQIATLPIASRPVARGVGDATELDDLRAIPWVFAWGQSRVNLPGWYGLGSGLEAVAARPGRPRDACGRCSASGRSSPR